MDIDVWAMAMNDEIREMLEEMKSIIDTGKDINGIKVDGCGFHGRDLKLLYDYITNLQEENEEWTMIFDTFSKRPYAHKYLEEKRKELGNDKIIGLDSEMIYKDYYDYKLRVEKASEDIKDIFKDEKWYENYEYNDLENALKNVLNILPNGSDDNG